MTLALAFICGALIVALAAALLLLALTAVTPPPQATTTRHVHVVETPGQRTITATETTTGPATPDGPPRWYLPPPGQAL